MNPISRYGFLSASTAFIAAMPLAARAQSTHLRVGAIVADVYAEAYYAMELGFFKKAGLDVELTTLTNGTAILSAALGGAVDIGISNTVAIATAVTHGFPVGFIAGGGLYDSKAPTAVLCVARNSEIQTAKDLEGKTVAVSALHDMNSIPARAWITKNGADVSKVQFIELPFAEMAPALVRGTVAAATIVEPQVTSARGTVRVLADFLDVIGPRFMNGGWFSTQAYARANPDVIKRFVDVIYATGAWANAHHSESAKILSKYSGVDLATMQLMARAVYADSLDPALIQPSIDLAYKFKLLDRAVNAREIMLTSATS